MSWIGDVIYDLKIDEGEPFFLNRDILSMDRTTGIKTKDNVNSKSFFFPLIIPLPHNVRQAFFKAINLTREAYLQPGEAQFAIDMTDIPSGFIVQNNDYLLDANSKRFDISSFENIKDEILLVTAKTVE